MDDHGTLTYREAGATRDPARLPPPGYRLLRTGTELGRGRAVFEAAGDALLGWGMHRAAGLGVAATAPRAAPGVRVTVTAGAGPLRLNAPCEVVWTVEEPDRRGFAYGTLPGHPVSGEEAFEVVRRPDGSVRLTVTAFSRGAAWYARAAGPLGRVAQRAAARRYGRALRRLASEAQAPDGKGGAGG
ncbi:DUF1990 domain-containing protein [Streptomyces sp. DSM 44917]|uniref:DUF1990 domain-containing protein n=1 Tax=Streptomyces boetiae TaxID=3075541 RepID=A0ABU2LG53_9ACTN|nr:DUF1990 domain-containing protein [Streptomyces sp. DSM 44917]MDT0310566.1 DUF1990 domain-containing protein [Streptomyces sp. DSM 44917]